jgi:hypothetical protein
VWFPGDPQRSEWTLYRLTPAELAARLEDQVRFEALVGTHWSYDLPKHMLRPRESQERCYAAQDREAERAREESFRAPARVVGRVTRWA